MEEFQGLFLRHSKIHKVEELEWAKETGKNEQWAKRKSKKKNSLDEKWGKYVKKVWWSNV